MLSERGSLQERRSGPGARHVGGRELSTDGESDEHSGASSGVTTPAKGRPPAQLALMGVAAVLLVLAAVVIVVAVRGNRESSTTLTPQSVAVGASVPLSSLDGQWSITPGADSWVGYSVSEDLLRVPMPNTAEGKTPGVDGGFVMKDGKVVAVAINADLSKLKSDDPERDETLTTRGLETTKFPAATFTLTSPIVISDPPTAGQPVTFVAKGDLTLHGVTKPVELDLQAQVIAGDPPSIEIVGDQQINFADFGIEAPNIANVVSVQDHGTLKIHLRLGRGQTPGTTKPA